MKIILTIVLGFLLVGLNGCLECADCTGCSSAEYDQELCYRDNNEYYRDRREWRDDVKSYESLYNCDCK